MKIAVLAGGISPERDVSLSSGAMIANALAEKGHAVVLLDEFLGIETPDGPAALFKKIPDYKPQYINVPSDPPDLDKVRAERVPDTGCNFGQNVLEVCKEADVVFIALHGEGGEDGQVQAAFDQMNMKTVWAGSYEGNHASARVQEKCGMKRHHTQPDTYVELLGEYRTEHFTRITRKEWRKAKEEYR